MKKLGRHSRQFFRIVAIDKRQQRDGRVIEQLGTYDPHMTNKEERVQLKASRIKYWLSVGAQPSHKVSVFIKKYLDKFTQLEEQGPATAETPSEEPAAEETPATE